MIKKQKHVSNILLCPAITKRSRATSSNSENSTENKSPSEKSPLQKKMPMENSTEARNDQPDSIKTFITECMESLKDKLSL